MQEGIGGGNGREGILFYVILYYIIISKYKKTF